MAGARQGRYKITNWAQYNRALVNRGSITLWLSPEVVAAWNHANRQVKRGRPFVFSDAAIECILTLREVFHLPYRQTEGFVGSLMNTAGLGLRVPTYTALAKRAANLDVRVCVSNRRGPLHMVVDSTGFKVFGEGEWKVRVHGKGKRRTWVKLHIGVDADTHEIVTTVVTGAGGHDADQVGEMLTQTHRPVATFRADGAYDKWKVYEALAARGAQPIIPPQKNARIKRHGNSSQPRLPRDQAIRRIRQVGRAVWKKEVGYHRRSLGETAMYRLKTIFGDELPNRRPPTQKAQCLLRCKALNRFTQLGMPKAEWV
jgi:hypothetical protein